MRAELSCAKDGHGFIERRPADRICGGWFGSFRSGVSLDTLTVAGCRLMQRVLTLFRGDSCGCRGCWSAGHRFAHTGVIREPKKNALVRQTKSVVFLMSRKRADALRFRPQGLGGVLVNQLPCSLTAPCSDRPAPFAFNRIGVSVTRMASVPPISLRVRFPGLRVWRGAHRRTGFTDEFTTRQP